MGGERFGGLAGPVDGEFEQGGLAEGDLATEAPDLDVGPADGDEFMEHFDGIDVPLLGAEKSGVVHAHRPAGGFITKRGAEGGFGLLGESSAGETETEAMVGTGLVDLGIDGGEGGEMALGDALAHLLRGVIGTFRTKMSEAQGKVERGGQFVGFGEGRLKDADNIGVPAGLHEGAGVLGQERLAQFGGALLIGGEAKNLEGAVVLGQSGVLVAGVRELEGEVHQQIGVVGDLLDRLAEEAQVAFGLLSIAHQFLGVAVVTEL